MTNFSGPSKSRLTRDQMLMGIAMIVSNRGTCNRASVGAVIASEGRVVSMGYVGSPPGHPHCHDVGCDLQNGGCVRTLHAESNAIAYAARKGISTEGCSLYTTLSPCLSCAKLILSAGITEVIYLGEYRDRRPLQYLWQSGILVKAYDDLDLHGSSTRDLVYD